MKSACSATKVAMALNDLNDYDNGVYVMSISFLDDSIIMETTDSGTFKWERGKLSKYSPKWEVVSTREEM